MTDATPSLIGSLGSAAAAVMVGWFLVVYFGRQFEQARAVFVDQLKTQHTDLAALTKEMGQLLREGTSANQRLLIAMEQIAGRLDRIETLLKIKPPVES